MKESVRQKIIRANAAALKAAGLSAEPANVGLGDSETRPKPSPSLEGFTGSSDPRLAAAARKRMKQEENPVAPAAEGTGELPEETACLTEQSTEERLKNAVDLTRDVLPPSPYDD